MDLLEIEKKPELKNMGKKYRKSNIQKMAENEWFFFSLEKPKRTQSNSPQTHGGEDGCHRSLCLLWDEDLPLNCSKGGWH